MMDDWTLAIFTVLSQMAAGTFVALYFLDKFKGGIELKTGFFVSAAIAVIMGLSLAVSTLHLGQPLEGYRALSNIGSSWLSREIVFMGAFFCFTLLYAWQWLKGYSRSLTGLLGSVIAVLGVFSSAMIYTMPSQPAWNNLGTTFFFFLTAASIGPIFLAALFKIKGYQFNENIISFFSIALAFNFLAYLLYLSMLAGAGAEMALSYEKIIGGGIFWLRLVVGFIVPLGLLAYKCFQENFNLKNYAIALFLLVFIGEILGRSLFYSSSVPVSMFGL